MTQWNNLKVIEILTLHTNTICVFLFFIICVFFFSFIYRVSLYNYFILTHGENVIATIINQQTHTIKLSKGTTYTRKNTPQPCKL